MQTSQLLQATVSASLEMFSSASLLHVTYHLDDYTVNYQTQFMHDMCSAQTDDILCNNNE